MAENKRGEHGEDLKNGFFLPLHYLSLFHISY